MKLKTQLPQDMFIQSVLLKNIQSMIFVYKRVVLNNLEHFLDWFKLEIETNKRFRDVYLIVCTNNMQFVVQQWAVMLGGLLGGDES
jgi:hypothetical protein